MRYEELSIINLKINLRAVKLSIDKKEVDSSISKSTNSWMSQTLDPDHIFHFRLSQAFPSLSVWRMDLSSIVIS